MTPEQKAAFVHRLSLGQTIAYDEAAFLAVPDRYGIGHNTVLSFFAE